VMSDQFMSLMGHINQTMRTHLKVSNWAYAQKQCSRIG
jgi:hypothetical protein